MCAVVSEGERLVFMCLMLLRFPYKFAVVGQHILCKPLTSRVLALTSETCSVVETRKKMLGCVRN